MMRTPMNRTLSTMILAVLSIICPAQRKAYLKDGTKLQVVSETASLTFHDPTVDFKPKDPLRTPESALLATVLTTLVDAGFSYLDSALKRNVEAYSSEFSAHQIYADQSGHMVPSFTVQRLVLTKENKPCTLTLKFEAVGVQAEKLRACFYQLKEFTVTGSRAKVKPEDLLDYSIEIKPIFFTIQSGERKKEMVGLKPLQLTSAPWEGAGIGDRLLCTDLFLIPPDGVFVELDVKVTETNPRKVKAQWVLDQWTKHQENVKSVVKDKLPSAELKVTMPPVATGKPNAVVSNDTK